MWWGQVWWGQVKLKPKKRRWQILSQARRWLAAAGSWRLGRPALLAMAGKTLHIYTGMEALWISSIMRFSSLFCSVYVESGSRPSRQPSWRRQGRRTRKTSHGASDQRRGPSLGPGTFGYCSSRKFQTPLSKSSSFISCPCRAVGIKTLQDLFGDEVSRLQIRRVIGAISLLEYLTRSIFKECTPWLWPFSVNIFVFVTATIRQFQCTLFKRRFLMISI